MNWKQQWINLVLGNIPASSYRKRTEAELRDHLETGYRALVETGRTEDNAQAEAVRVMGEPEKLHEEYQAAWERTLESKVFGGMIGLFVFIFSMILMVILYLFTLLPAMRVMDLFDLRQMSIEPTTLYKAVVITFGSLTFLIPYTAIAAFLCLYFYRSRHRAALITSQLLVLWAVSNWLFILMYGVMDEIDQYRQVSMMDFVVYFYNKVPYDNIPWMTPLYHLLTFLGCIVLGVAFGKFSTRADRLAAG